MDERIDDEPDCDPQDRHCTVDKLEIGVKGICDFTVSCTIYDTVERGLWLEDLEVLTYDKVTDTYHAVDPLLLKLIIPGWTISDHTTPHPFTLREVIAEEISDEIDKPFGQYEWCYDD